MKTRELPPRPEAQRQQALFDAISRLETAAECRAFFKDLCTPTELQALADRWKAVLLLEQNIPYREIHQKTGVSVTTVGRVARCLRDGEGGYSLVLSRMQEENRDG